MFRLAARFLWMGKIIMSKNVVVILGYESSGSVFIGKVVSYVLGKCDSFGAWNGYGFNGEIGDQLVILHRSMPYGRPKRWHDNPEEIKEIFVDYQMRFVICTRDPTISQLSRTQRFGGSFTAYSADTSRATSLFAKVMARYPFYIWNFETMLTLGNSYFDDLYKWLDIKSEFYPTVKDANRPYIITT